MVSLKILFNNLRYLARYNLKEIYHNLKNAHFDVEYMEYSLDHIRYEISRDLKNMKKIKILSIDDSLDLLIKKNASLARFGDGEINLMFGNSIPCQIYDKKLCEKLKTTLFSLDSNLMIGLPNLFASYEHVKPWAKRFGRTFYGKYTPLLLNMLNEEYVYSSTEFTFPYINVGCNDDEEYFESYYKKFRQVWDNMDIVIVSGDRVFNKIQYNIYDNAKSIEYIKAPTNNTFSDYEKILSLIKTKEKHKIIILVLGPTATVLAYDLAQIGYRALDLGHLCKDYDAYKRKIEVIEENAFKFFNPE